MGEKEAGPRLANSFTPSEVRWLNQMFKMMARGDDIRNLRAKKEYAQLYQKVLRMNEKMSATAQSG
jgi:hypothetical protein